MVDRNLQSAADELGTVVTSFDVASIVTAAAGVGGGLFAAEFAGAWVTDRVGGGSDATGFLADVGSRAALAFGFVQASKMGAGPMLDVLLVMAGFGAASSAVLRVIESVAESAAGNVSGSAPSVSAATNAQTVDTNSGSVTRVSASKNGGTNKNFGQSVSGAF